jgi:hypothetical protein
MLDAGIGPTHINALFSCLNIPGISDSLLKRHERHVGQAIEKVANSSCYDAAVLEKECTEGNRPCEQLQNNAGIVHDSRLSF